MSLIRMLDNHKNISIAAIILAAGKGERIGRPKWQLEFHGQTFLEIILAKLQACQGITAITCVVAAEMVSEVENCRGTARRAQNISLTINPNPDYGMLSSIYYGAQALANQSNQVHYDGYLIFPVDHPFVQSQTIKLLMDNFAKNFIEVGGKDGDIGNLIVMPRYQNHGKEKKCGHPIIVAQKILESLTPDILQQLSFKEFLVEQKKHSQCQTITLDVDDAGVLQNVNTKDWDCF